VIESESQIAAAKAREDGKPEAILPRIVEGSLNKFKDEFVLLRQTYVRDDSMTVQQLVNQAVVSLGENVVIRRFARWALGETSAE
jgi:elongation factor Ts